METGEFSFYLAPSKVDGVGVFAAHPIAAGTVLNMYGDESEVLRRKEDIPRRYYGQFVWLPEGVLTPPDLRRMAIGWYMNHSLQPNAAHRDDWEFYALRDIAKDEEILTDYRTLGEPRHEWEWFYDKKP